MSSRFPSPAVERTYENARAALLEARLPGGPWRGHLSSSALATATAVTALELSRRHGAPVPEGLAAAGVRWLAAVQNEDGGFGDTPESPSNLSTTALAWAALGLVAPGPSFERAESRLRRDAGDLSPARLAEEIARPYGEDRTFSAPILTMCALTGRLDGLATVPALPFELAALPRALFRAVDLQVVSYALPALIAIGQARHLLAPPANPLTRLVRDRAVAPTTRLLEALQPTSGGFLEAIPLTSFVVMSLAATGRASHPVARRGLEFLAATARDDGSWPIDTDLATWVTTLSIGALSLGPGLPDDARRDLLRWLLDRRTRETHPFTGSAPGGFPWTDRPGGLPDADDTAGALLALRHLAPRHLAPGPDSPTEADVRSAAEAGARWLLGLQNRDGGFPTFCRGWGRLPFDRSAPDLTAHAIRALSAWPLPGETRTLRRALRRAFSYLLRTQRPDDSWSPLWFGSQRRPDQENPIYGTSRVLLCAPHSRDPAFAAACDRAVAFLLATRDPDGGYGTIEETALALEALAVAGAPEDALARAATWLADRTAEGTRFPPAPIGLYFAKLWYWERLYPLVFTVSALGRLAA